MERIKQENINTNEYWDNEHDKRDGEVSMRFEMVADLVRRASGRKVLDIGCGLGELYNILSESNFQTVFYGVDFSRSAIDRCQEEYQEAEWAVGEIGNLPFDDKKFDTVVSSEVLEHLEDPQKLVDDMKRIVKDDGVMILTTPFENMTPSEEHLWSFDEQDIRELFEGYKVRFARVFPSVIFAYITKQ